LAHELAGKEHEVTVFGSHIETRTYWDDSVRVELVQSRPMRYVGWALERFALRKFLRHAVRGNRFDIVEIPEHGGMVPWRVNGVPIVVRLHLSWLVWWHYYGKPSHNRWMPYSETRTLKGNPYWIACSNYILQETSRLTGIVPALSRVIYNANPDSLQDEPKPLQSREKIILFAGRVSVRKGALALTRAAQIFLPQLPEYRLVFAGEQDVIEGKIASERFREIVGPALKERLHFTGRLGHDGIMDLMKRSAVFVFPSHLEAFSVVVLEAMAAGMAVVYSTKHSGPETIVDGVDGLLANPDSHDDIAEKVVRLCKNLPYAEQLAEKGRKKVVTDFSLKKCAEDTLKFYTEVLQKTNS
jgi:glycosyltransferase involved in cell wall biosynthesis